MNITFKYDFDTPIYMIKKNYQDIWNVQKCIGTITKVETNRTGYFNYYIEEDMFTGFWVRENAIDDVDNSYYFSSYDLALEACKVATQKPSLGRE